MKALRESAAGCEGCDLYVQATQTVFGEGPVHAKLLFVGEQPGDSEDLQGHPFVGPAGRVLHEGMAAAGIDPDAVYITNAVNISSSCSAGNAAFTRPLKCTRYARAGRGSKPNSRS
jgi:uracil-DNA glycosylase family 4